MNPLRLLRSKNPTVASICLQPLHVCRRLASQVLLVLVCLSGLAKADYTFDSTTGTITGYIGAGGAVVIPASIDGTPVTAIGNQAFSPGYQGIQSITSVTIPNSVTSIGNYAFVNCMSLTSVTIPNSVTSIGSGAFQGCIGLTTVTIPNNVTSIGLFTFYSCRSLTSVTIPASVTSIGDAAFSECSGLTSLTIPNSVTSIGTGTFENCSGLTSVTIGSGVTSIGPVAFRGCSGLANIEVDPNNLTYTSVGGVLHDKNQTTLIQCPAGKSGSYTIPNSVTSIGNEAFAGCSGLTSVTIGSGVTTLGDGAFAGCSGLANIEVDPNNLTYTSVGGGLYDKNQTTLIQCPAGKSGSYTIPNSVTNIGNGAFAGCSGLTSVTIPNSVTNIGDEAFAGCSGLTSVTIGSGVASIGSRAFSYCSGITHFVFTGNAPTIGLSFFSSPFYGVPFGATVRYSSAATGWGATFGGLTAVADYLDVLTYSTANNQVTITGYTGTGGVVIIPASIGGAPVTAIGENAFLGSSSLTSVTIPNSVTSIGGGAFSGCSGLTNIEVDTNNLTYTSVGGVLYNKDQTTLIQFPAGKSGSYTIPNSVTSIGNTAFANCSSLTSVTIPNSVTNIGSAAFQGCSGLTSVTIPDNVTSIGGSAFAGCSNLVSLLIGSGITSIGNEAFAGCSSLPRVIIPVATVLGIDAFPSTTTILRYLSEAQLTSRDSAQNAAGQAAGRALGQADVTSAPNTYGLYNLSQVQALNVGTPLLAKDSATGKFKLTVKAKKSTDLVNYSDMPFSAEDAVINSNGEMEFQFASPDNAAFFRIESR